MIENILYHNNDNLFYFDVYHNCFDIVIILNGYKILSLLLGRIFHKFQFLNSFWDRLWGIVKRVGFNVFITIIVFISSEINRGI